MNNDGKLMYRLCTGIEDGNVDTVKDLRIGPLCSARWLTFGARLLRLYTSQPDVSEYDKEVIDRMANYIIKVYFKVGTSYTFSFRAIVRNSFFKISLSHLGSSMKCQSIMFA